MLNKFLKSYAYSIGSILIASIILTLLNYFNILKPSIISILKIVIPIICLFIGAFMIGRVSNKKGYIEGLKYGGIYLIFIILLNLIIIRSFEISNLIYYLIILISTMLGSMIGINLKKKN